MQSLFKIDFHLQRSSCEKFDGSCIDKYINYIYFISFQNENYSDMLLYTLLQKSFQINFKKNDNIFLCLKTCFDSAMD